MLEGVHSRLFNAATIVAYPVAFAIILASFSGPVFRVGHAILTHKSSKGIRVVDERLYARRVAQSATAARRRNPVAAALKAQRGLNSGERTVGPVGSTRTCQTDPGWIRVSGSNNRLSGDSNGSACPREVPGICTRMGEERRSCAAPSNRA